MLFFCTPMHTSLISYFTFQHPIHLHGHSFSVVRSAGSTEYNYVNPVRRDVVNTGTETTDNVTIRFETNNPGPWIMHWFVLLSLNYRI